MSCGVSTGDLAGAGSFDNEWAFNNTSRATIELVLRKLEIFQSLRNWMLYGHDRKPNDYDFQMSDINRRQDDIRRSTGRSTITASREPFRL